MTGAQFPDKNGLVAILQHQYNPEQPVKVNALELSVEIFPSSRLDLELEVRSGKRSLGVKGGYHAARPGDPFPYPFAPLTARVLQDFYLGPKEGQPVNPDLPPGFWDIKLPALTHVQVSSY